MSAMSAPVFGNQVNVTANPLTCPQMQPKKALEVRTGCLVDGKFQPLGGFTVQLADGGHAMTSVSSADFPVRFEGLDDKSYDLSLRGLDQNAWEVFTLEALESHRLYTPPGATWQFRLPDGTPGGPANLPPGFGIDKLALQVGHLPETIWNDPGNAGLRSTRHGRNVLVPNEQVFIPPLQAKNVSAQAGYRYFLIRKQFTSRIRIRLCYGMQPMPSFPYFFEAPNIAPVADLTNDDGILDREVPATTDAVKITYADPIGAMVLKLETLLPVTDDNGVKQRLRNLGFPYVNDTHAWAPGVIKRAQQALNQTVTGAVTEDLRKALFGFHDR